MEAEKAEKVPKPTSALFRVDEPETKVEFPKRKWSSRNESRVPETKGRVPETKIEFPKRSSRNQSRSSQNETGGPETKKGLGNNRHGQKINNDLHEFTCACGDLFLMHDSIVVHQLGSLLIGRSTACHHSVWMVSLVLHAGLWQNRSG